MKESKNTAIEYKGWHVVRRIGTGSFGSVYEIEREDFGYTYKAALKVISCLLYTSGYINSGRRPDKQR